MSANGIAHLATKEDRQKAKLELAATDRAATGRRAVYDINELPTQYSGDTVVDNSNPDGLLLGRPWVDISRTGLQLYFDPASTASYPGTGTTITDLSTNAYTGTLTGGVGFSNDALTFDGVNDYIDTNQSLASNDFTVIAWFKASANVTAYRMLVSKETPVTGAPWNYRLYLNQTNGKLTGDITNGTTGAVTSTAAYNTDTWTMGVFVRDTTADTLTLYVNGSSVASATDPTTGSMTNPQEVWIGRSAFGTNYPYLGSIGEVMIYNRALSAAEIAITFRATRSRYGV